MDAMISKHTLFDAIDKANAAIQDLYSELYGVDITDDAPQPDDKVATYARSAFAALDTIWYTVQRSTETDGDLTFTE